MTNITAKQIVTLVILVAVLVLVVAGQYLIRPLLTKAGELNGKSDKMDNQYQYMQNQALIYEVDKQDYQNLMDQINEEKKNLLPVMKSSQLDKIVTDLVLSSGLTINSLNIGESNTYKVRLPYLPAQSTGSKTADSDKSDSGDEKDINGMAPPDEEKYPGAEIVTDNDGQFFLEYNTGEYSVELCYELTGKYDNILKLINKISENNSMSIGGINFENSEALSDQCMYKTVISVIVYMYDQQPDF